jgi:hypothetical protein
MKISVRGNSDMPDCYGKYWDPNAPECAESYDPSSGVSTGGHCDYWTTCMQRTQAAKHLPVVRPPAGNVQPNQGFRPYTNKNQPPQQQQGYYGYQQMMPVNYQVPAFLTVREPAWRPRGHRFAVEVGRSLVKSLGHTIAAFADLEAFLSPPEPPPMLPPPPTEEDK